MSLILDGTAGVTGPATKVIVGTTTNDDAVAGYVGEVTSALATTNAVNLTNAAGTNATSISLTAGDWDVYGIVAFVPAASTVVTRLIGGISTVSGTNSILGQYTDMPYTLPTGVAQVIFTTPSVRFSLAATTTIYLTLYSQFTVSTMTGGGYIRARRAR
jgi:hypothetical protein